MQPLKEQYHVKALTNKQHQEYLTRLSSSAKSVALKYSLSEEDLYKFLTFLINKSSEYKKAERLKLAYEMRTDIIYQAELIWGVTGKEWEEVAEEIGKTNPFWVKGEFLQANLTTKIYESAHTLISAFFEAHKSELESIKLQENDVNTLLQFCRDNELDLLLYTLDDMIGTGDEDRKFWKVTRYKNIKELSTSFEYFLKIIAAKGAAKGQTHLAALEGGTLRPVLNAVMKNEKKLKTALNTKSTDASSGSFFKNLKSDSEYFKHLDTKPIIILPR